jgi:flagellar hook-associated protein 1 FlgK
MAGLIDSLSSAADALNAQRLGLDVAGQNLANVNTDGYSRRTLVLAERPTTTDGTGGVDVLRIDALRDTYVQNRLDTESQSASYSGAIAGQLSTIAAAIGQPGTSVDGALSSFFDAFASLAQDPTSTVARDTVVLQGQGLAQSFNDMSARLTSARQAADTNLRGDANQVNTLINQIATLNGQIMGQSGPSVETLKDQRTVAISQLSSLIGAVQTPASDGSIGVTVGNGQPLVIGNTPYQVVVGNTSNGLATFSILGQDVTSQITHGEMGGLLAVRDTLVPRYQAQLDQLAYDVASRVNTLHQAGFTGTGTTNQTFFTPLATVAGAASALAVDPAVAANSSLVAAGATNASGDNQNAQAIAALRATKFASSGSATPSDAWAQFAYQVGSDTSTASNARSNQQQIVSQLTQLRDSVSKVSPDEEAASLMRFQRAYEANARYFTTVVQTLDTLMAMVQAIP